MAQQPGFFAALIAKIHTAFGGSETTLKNLQDRYEKELIPYKFQYSVSEKGKKPQKVILEFDEGNFCHLFSIASIVQNVTPDTESFSGYKGWKNIREGRITFRTLRQMDPQQFDYYHPEHKMFDEMVSVIRDPKMVRYQPEKVKNSRLEADLILYGICHQKVVHIALSRDRDGTYFPRSYFVRDVSQDRTYPSKYVANMPVLSVKTKVSSK